MVGTHWSKGWIIEDNVGSHIIRNNEIYYCEQTGICGSMGGSFTEIYGNHIHNCQKGIWMDWMAQGSRFSCNLFYDNVYMNLFYEVDHGPYVCDNNIMLSECSLWDWSESGTYLHNLFGGSIYTKSDDRFTPYHLAHLTEIKGVYKITGSDNRFVNNVFSPERSGIRLPLPARLTAVLSAGLSGINYVEPKN